MSFSMCRVCLVDNSRMLNVDNIYLLNMYEKLTNTKLNAEADNRMPSTICYVCHRQLQKCLRFFNMAQKSNRILRELLHNTCEEPHTTLITPSQEIMHHLVVTPTEHITIDICLNTTSISPVTVNEDLLTVKGEKAKNKDIDDKALKLERLDEDIGKCISFNPKQHSINNCSNTTSISSVTVKEEELYVKEEIANEYIDDEALKETLDEDEETFNDPNKTEQSQENNIDVKSSFMDLCFYCDVCNKQMSNKNLLVQHLKAHTQVHTGGMLYSCNICEKAFSHKSNMTRHMRGHTKKKAYPCNSCDKSFNHISNLTKHMRDHTGEKPYPCKSCDKAFTKISDLKRHMRVHTGEKPFSCNSCDKAFTQKSNLTFHMRVHTGEKPYPCNRCDKAFVKKEHLNRHMRVHTGEKPFSCNLCDKAFTDRSDLIKHTRVHTGEKPYPCNRCDKVFTQKCGLKRHMRVHTREKPFFCNTCEKTFTDEGKLTSHRRRLHTMEILIPATV